jgi:2TM family of unknown function (DUF5676)
MTKLNPWIFGLVVAITVVISYVLCTLFWLAFTEPSMDFLNTLFHGMDFRKIYAPAAFSWADYLMVLVVFAVWGYLVGVIYAAVRNLLLSRSTA